MELPDDLQEYEEEYEITVKALVLGKEPYYPKNGNWQYDAFGALFNGRFDCRDDWAKWLIERIEFESKGTKYLIRKPFYTGIKGENSTFLLISDLKEEQRMWKVIIGPYDDPVQISLWKTSWNEGDLL